MIKNTKGHEVARTGNSFAVLAAAILLVFLSAQLTDAQNLKLEIGETLSAKDLKKQKKNHLMAIHPSQLNPFIETKIDGIKFTIAFDEETKKIVYIRTTDSKFVTADERRVEDLLELNGRELLIYPYWDVYGPRTSDGWWPVVGSVTFPWSEKFYTEWKPDEKRSIKVYALVKSRYLSQGPKDEPDAR